MTLAFCAARLCQRNPSTLLSRALSRPIYIDQVSATRPSLSKPLGSPQRLFSTLNSQARNHAPRCSRWWRFRAPPPPGRKTLLASSVGAGAAGAAGLTPAAFVIIGEEEKDDDKTGEEHMLEASREEIEQQLPEWVAEHKTIFGTLYTVLDTFIIEPIATGLRFIHLAFIFIPVLVTAPAVWIGKADPNRDGARPGSIWWYGVLVNAMERAGPAFIKLGQWAASRTDIFPKEMCSRMASLHSNAPAHSLRRTKKIVQAAFDGRPFDQIFEEFQEKPLGVGAIAQVYKAKLKSDLAAVGDPDVDDDKPSLSQRVKKNVDAIAKKTPQRVPSSYVAVKVLHPNVERTVRRDLRIMGFFAAAINAIPTMEWLSFPDEVRQFGEMMQLQLDLRIESANLTMFRKHFKERTTAWFPYPYSEFSTRQVLVEEFAHGIPLAAFLEDGGGVFQKEIADEGLDAFMHMLLIDNFIHADLHPGNIMVRFYKPVQMDVGPSIDVVSRTRSVPQQTTGPPHNPDEAIPPDQADVTEQVLSQLRPYRHQPDAWASELDKIDAQGYRPQLIFIDTGLVTELNGYNRKNFLDLFKAVAEFDGYKAGHLMVERCRQPDAVVDPEVFALRMQHLVLGVKSKTFALGNIKIGDILSEVLDMVRSHHVRLEGDFVNVVLSILLLEGIGRSLDPDLDLFAGALPILRRLGTQSGTSMLRSGDFSMIKVWAGLEARKFITVSVEEVERCVKYDQLAPNV